VFAVEVGGVTDPIPTEHGYWLLRVDEITKDKKPDLESIKGKVILSISKRKESLRVEDLKDEMRVAHNFKLDEDALKLAYQGLPEGEQIIDPETQQPVPKDQLKPLDIPSNSYDTVLLTYDLTEGPFALTLADLKSKFDKMNVFERPKRHEMLGSLRTRLTNDAEKAIMVDEARRRGYFEDPRVMHEVDIAMEELLVDKVHQEIVDFEEYVSPEALEEFWAEHKTEYFKPERRSGYMVRCADLETANTARKAVTEEEKTWKQVNNLYGNDPELEKVFGRVDRVRVDDTGTVRDLLFAMSIDEVSEPVQTPEGWIVVQLTKVFEPEQPELKELTEVIGQRIKNSRKDEALRAMLNDWADEFGVVVYEDRLAAMPSYDQLMEENMRAKMSMPEK
jgi:hypothetical protein